MAHIKFDGFDEFENELNQLSKKAKELSGGISFGDLFNDDFIQEHTEFANIVEFFKSGGFNINNEKDFDAIPQDELDKHTADTTDFEDWEDMMGAAFEEYSESN